MERYTLEYPDFAIIADESSTSSRMISRIMRTSRAPSRLKRPNNKTMWFKGVNMAYLDPGSGSFLLQLLIAAILGGLIAIRAYWGRLISFIRRIFSREEHKEENE